MLLTTGKWYGIERDVRFGYGTPTDYVKGGLDKIAESPLNFDQGTSI